jgi:hypothetical protein
MGNQVGLPGFGRGSLLAVLLALASGCAASLSSFQPAHVGPRHQVRAVIGGDLAVPTGTIDTAIDVARALGRAAQSRTLSEDEKLQLFEAGVKIALTPPAFDQHLAASYNFADAWEVSLRYAGGGLRVGSRHQFLAQEQEGVDLSAGLGIARYSYDFGLTDLVDVLNVGGVERWNLDLPLVAGWHGRFFRVWGGPRLAFMHHRTDIVLRLPGNAGEPGGPAREEIARSSGTGAFWGAQLGGAVGYRWIFVAAELTVVRFSGNANLDVFGRTAKADTSTTIFTPGIGLQGEF